MSVLPKALTTFPSEGSVALAGFAQGMNFLSGRSFREECLTQSKHIRVSRNSKRNHVPTLVKLTLSGCTVLIASVLPCKNAFVIAGSYVHSTLPYSPK